MQKDNNYDLGSVVPRFHNDEHRQQLAILLVLDGEDLKQFPKLIGYPVKVQLKRSAQDLEESNAPDFVEDYRKAEACLDAIRAILKILYRTKKDAAHDTSDTLDRQQ